MRQAELCEKIYEELKFTPTSDQQAAIETFSEFILTPGKEIMMLLCGAAGTGKTSVASAIVRTLKKLGQKTVLLCPTGRACKVFSHNCGSEVSTIHRKIYRQKSFKGLDTPFQLDKNRHVNTLFIVDEASMINHDSSKMNWAVAEGENKSIFGTGDLLDDLMQYVYTGNNCRLMLIGDRAQLPPVGDYEAPALKLSVLEGYGVTVYHRHMDEVLRQAQESGVLYNATMIRKASEEKRTHLRPEIKFEGFNDLHITHGSELIEELSQSYSEVGQDETMVVVRSNEMAVRYNRGIRSMILDNDELLCAGDRVMIVKNNYFYTGKDETLPMSFIANGDIAIVKRVKRTRDIYGYHYMDVVLRFPDYRDCELECKLILDSLNSNAPSLTWEEQKKLEDAILEDYDGMDRRKALRLVRESEYYNALQVKYAYAVTCHKAQGGQWKKVFIEQGGMSESSYNDEYYKWLYTAFTRTTKDLYLINWRQ